MSSFGPLLCIGVTKAVLSTSGKVAVIMHKLERYVIGGGRFLVLADYRAQSHNEISLQEGDLVEVLKIGCGGWWFVRVLGHFYQGLPIEGWAPSAYLEPSKRRHQIQDGRTDHKNIVSRIAH